MLQEIAYGVLGFLVAVIFVLDGWRSPPKEAESIKDSPKIKGLLFVLGGSLIPTVQVLATDKKEVLAVFALAFGVTTLLLLAGLSVYAFLFAYKRVSGLASHETKRAAVIEALPFVVVALSDGLPTFRQEIEARSVALIVEEREILADMLVGISSALDAPEIKNSKDATKFVGFVERYLEAFVLNVLERTRIMRSFRACIYWRDTSGEHLNFLVGVSPATLPHTRQPLPIKSLGGLALNRLGELLVHSAEGSNAPQSEDFHKREGNQKYSFVMTCAIHGFHEPRESKPRLVFCVDSALQQMPAMRVKFFETAMFAFSQSLAHARSVIDVSNEQFDALFADKKK